MSSNSAAVDARYVFPTPGGPANRNVAPGLLRFFSTFLNTSLWKYPSQIGLEATIFIYSKTFFI